MSNSSLTGTEIRRFEEIQRQWLVFEPTTSPMEESDLYTVPLGQTVEPEFIIHSASYSHVSGAIEIEKIIHRFTDETDAAKFLTEIGLDNVVSYREVTEDSALYGIDSIIEIQVINYPTLTFEFNYLDFEANKGCKLEVFKSGSIAEGGTRKVTDKVVFDKNGTVISDTYLKYFQIETDD